SAALGALLDAESGIVAHLMPTVVRIGPLDEEDARRLARHRFPPGVALDERLVAAIARESQGSPLFIGELVQYACDQAAAGSLEGVRLDALVQDRITRLGVQPKKLLEAVAVAGRPVALAAAAKAAGLDS